MTLLHWPYCIVSYLLLDQPGLCAGAALQWVACLARFKLEMNWNQEELEQWAIAARQKEEDLFRFDKGVRLFDKTF